MKESTQVGIVHSLTQIVTFGIYSGGVIFLLPLALAEINGWVILGLWMGLNFLGLPFIINVMNKVFNRNENSSTITIGLNIFMIGCCGGLIAFILNLIYYRFHMYYIDKEFKLSDYKDDLLPTLTSMTLMIIIGEIIRLKNILHLITNTGSRKPPAKV